MRENDFGLNTLLDLTYPRHCPYCDEIVGFSFSKRKLIHRECAAKIKYVGKNRCLKCGKDLGADDDREYCADCEKVRHTFTRGFAVFDYRSVAGSIYRFKYGGRQEYAEFYAGAIYRRFGRIFQRLGIEAIVPVPMYKGKERKRGYNQAGVLAKEVAKRTGIPFYPKIAVRVRDTRPMKELSAADRRNNLKKAFNIAENDVKFKSILIIDDIYTTGSTIDELAHEFRSAGVEKIYFLTLAIGQNT